MTDPTCPRCAQPIADTAYVCSSCARRLQRDLLGDATRDDRPGLVDTTPAARDIAYGLARHDTTGGTTGKPGSRLPLQLAAAARLDSVQGQVTTWARHVAEERSGGLPGLSEADPIIAAAQYLAVNLDWLRHRPEADEAFRDLTACCRIVAGIARGPGAQRYLGPCGTPRQCDISTFDEPPGSRTVDGEPCDGDVYARISADGSTAATGYCRTCAATVDTAARRLWLDEQVRDRAFRDTEIAGAYGLNVKTIRSWATDRPEIRNGAGRLVRSATPIRLHPHTHDRDSQPLYLVGEVLDLAAADAARRAGDQATRARRAATRAAETEGATA